MDTPPRLLKIEADLTPGLREIERKVNQIISGTISGVSRASGDNKYQKFFKLRVVANDALSQVSPHAPCKSGCSQCCHQAVSITDYEAELLEQASGRKRVPIKKVSEEQYHALTQTAGKWKGTPCSFLGSAGECTVYEARPLFCRTHNSVEETAAPCDIRNSPGHHSIDYSMIVQAAAWEWVTQGEFGDIREYFPPKAAIE